MTKSTSWHRHALLIVLHGDAAPVIAVGEAGTQGLEDISCHCLIGSTAIKLPTFPTLEPHKADRITLDMWMPILCPHPKPLPRHASHGGLAGEHMAGGLQCLVALERVFQERRFCVPGTEIIWSCVPRTRCSVFQERGSVFPERVF